MSRGGEKWIAAAILVVGSVSLAAMGTLYGMSVNTEEPEPEILEEDCSKAKNTCADYSKYWKGDCADYGRCITFKNSCMEHIALSYQTGCDGDGKAGAPQCNCTSGPTLKPGESVYWQIIDADYTSCMPSWTPQCLTAGLAIMANENLAACSKGTRIEFTAGNSADPYGKFDSYNIDVEKAFYSIPVSFKPDIKCAIDDADHNCRPLWCDEADCPDAYDTPTSGGCPDGRSPQAGCQDTFNEDAGYTVEFCPATGKSCQDAKACPPS